MTYEDASGVLVQIDPETRDFLGVMLVDYAQRWEGRETH